MKKVNHILFFIFLMLLSDIYGYDTITLINGEYPPLTSENLPNYGFFSQLVTEAFKAADIEVNYIFYPWTRGWYQIKQGTAAGSLAYIKSTDREEIVLYSDVVWTGNSTAAFYLKSNNLNITKPSDLTKYRVTIQRGYSYGDETDSLLEEGKIENIAVEQEIQAFKMLLSDRTDIFLSNEINGIFTLNTILPDKKHLFGSKVFDKELILDYHLIISKKMPNGDEIINKFNQGLQIIKNNGVYDSIVPKL